VNVYPLYFLVGALVRADLTFFKHWLTPLIIDRLSVLGLAVPLQKILSKDTRE
jgi:hypothetical protein